MNKIYLPNVEVISLTRKLAGEINSWAADNMVQGRINVYCVPRGGVPVGYLLANFLPIDFVDTLSKADIVIDDLIDSGATREKILAEREVPFFALLRKDQPPYKDAWVIFPWEAGLSGDQSGEDIVTRLLQYIGEDPARGGLLETPKRFLSAWRQWTRGYGQSPADILKTFEDGAERVNELVLVKGIPFYSHCEHHLAPFFGVAHIGYIPSGKIVGLSKLSRLLDIYARRLQVQERLTNQIADSLVTHLKPQGVGVVIEARHLCMESRGICKQGHSTTTSAMRGVLMDSSEARAEFLSLIKQ